MIVVTGPTGQIGSKVIAHLLAADASVHVIARHPDKLSADVRARVKIIEGSHGDAAVLDRALPGMEALFWLVAADPGAASVDDAFVGFSRAGATAISRYSVARVVNVTAIGRGTRWADAAGYVTGSIRMDDLLAGTGAAFRGIAAPSLMENIARQIAPIREQGMFFGAQAGGRRMPTCATRDVAAVASRLLLDDGWNGIGHPAVLGPEDLSFNDMAAIMSDVLGKPIRYQQIALSDYRAGFVQRGFSAPMADGMADMAAAKDQGLDQTEPRTPDNTTPTSFREWCKSELKPAVLG